MSQELKKPTYEHVLRSARDLFLQGDRIDMGALALSMGISRATLYRWVGDRDRLIGEIIWSLTEPFLLSLDAGLSGPERIKSIIRDLGRQVLSTPPVRTFLSRDPVSALRILTTRSSEMQRKMVEFFTDVLNQEIAKGKLPQPSGIDVESLAYAILRIAESFFYADVVADRLADADVAAQIVGLLMEGVAATRQ